MLIYGTPIGTEEFSGRYRVDIYDILLAGEMKTYTEEHFREPMMTMPGELPVLHQAKGVYLARDHGCWNTDAVWFPRIFHLR